MKSKDFKLHTRKRAAKETPNNKMKNNKKRLLERKLKLMFKRKSIIEGFKMIPY